MTYEIDHDDLWPRDERHRYRIYRHLGDELEVLACTPTAGGIGCALVQLHDDCKEAGLRLADLGMIGVLDVIAGDWVLLPWVRPTEPVTFGPKPRRIRAANVHDQRPEEEQ